MHKVYKLDKVVQDLRRQVSDMVVPYQQDLGHTELEKSDSDTENLVESEARLF